MLTLPDSDSETRAVLLDAALLRRVMRRVYVVIALLGVGHFIAVTLRSLGYGFLGGIVPFFDLSVERSLGTWVSALLMVSGGVAAAFCGAVDGRVNWRWRWNWRLLALMLTLMSIDEVCTLHETVSSQLRNALGTSGALYAAWVIPAMVVVLAFAAAQLRWLRNLPRRTAGNLILAGVVFVAAAAGLEAIESAMYEAAGRVFTYAYDLVSMVEEVGELWAEAWVLSTLSLFVLASVGAVKIAAAEDLGR